MALISNANNLTPTVERHTVERYTVERHEYHILFQCYTKE
jgi:hypothetical protein